MVESDYVVAFPEAVPAPVDRRVGLVRAESPLEAVERRLSEVGLNVDRFRGVLDGQSEHGSAVEFVYRVPEFFDSFQSGADLRKEVGGLFDLSDRKRHPEIEAACFLARVYRANLSDHQTQLEYLDKARAVLVNSRSYAEFPD